jgi:hypothetical protein
MLDGLRGALSSLGLTPFDIQCRTRTRPWRRWKAR